MGRDGSILQGGASVEAVFASHLQKHSYSHDGRIEALKDPIFSGLFKPYRHLFGASLVARYLEDGSARKFDDKSSTKRYRRFSDYMSPSDVVSRLLKKRLYLLEQQALTFLSEDGKKSLKKIDPAKLLEPQ